MRRFTAKEADVGVRADVFIAEKYPKFTRSALSRLFSEARVTLNGKPAKAGHRLRSQDKLIVDDSLINNVPAPANFPTLYEDNDIVVINKPAGVLTHAKGAINDEATVASSARAKIDPAMTGNRAGVVHRLDRGTSGVIVVAKKPEVLANLQKQFSKRLVKKTYRAVVEGKVEPAEAIIDAPIARNPKRPQTFMVRSDGKPSQTQYKLLATQKVGSLIFSTVELTPTTGRTHQLRVHLAYIGHPIAGDSVYGHAGELMLHAHSLQFKLPSGQIRTFTAPIPERFSVYADGNS